MKKLFTAIMVIAVLLGTAVTGVYAKNLNPYEEIFALEHDQLEVVLPNGKTEYMKQDGYVSDLGTGGAIVFRDVDFGKLTPKTVLLYAGIPQNAAARVDLRLDSATGPLIAIIQVANGEDWGVRTEHRTEVLAEASGVHDLWLVQAASNERIYSFKFIPEEYELEPIGQYDGTGEYPADTKEEDKFFCELIGGLGFKGGNDTVDPNFPVTRGNFAAFIDWVMNYYNDGEKYFNDVHEEHEQYEAITRLASHDVVHGYGDLTFRPDTFITGSEAATICANALGYNKFSNSSYGTKKAQLISAAGIKDASAPIDTASAMKMLYEFLTSDYIYVDISNKAVNEKTNILEVTRDIYLRKGVVDGNPLGYLDNPAQNTDKDYITINKEMHYSPSCKAQKYLGRNCEYFVFDDGEAAYPQVLSVAQERRSTETVITHENEPYISGNVLYYQDENGKERKIKLSQSTTIIYNQKTYESADIAQVLDMQNLKYENGLWVSNGQDKKEFQGEVRAVSYKGSNEADVIYVNYYENVLSAGYDSNEHVLRTRLSDKTWYVNVTDANSYGIVTIDGVVSSVDALKKNMGGVIYESINVDGIKAVNAYYTSDKVTGKLTSINEDEVEIDSVIYEVAPEFLKLDKLVIGYEGDYILTPYGDLVWMMSDFSFTDNPKDRIVTFIKGYSDDDGEVAYLRVYDLKEDAVVEYTLADKVRFDGERTNDVQQIMYGTVDYDGKMGFKSLKKGYVLKIRLDADNKVNFIDSPITCGGGINDCVKLLTSTIDGEALVWRPNANIFGGTSTGNRFAVNSDAHILYSSSPSSDTYEADGFIVDTMSSLSKTDKTRQFTLFSFNYDSSVADFVVRYTDAASETSEQIYIFKGVCEDVLDYKEDITKTVEIYNYGMSEKRVVSTKYLAVQDPVRIAVGSLVKLGFDSHGEIIAINVVYSPDGSAGLISADNPESEGTINSGSRMVYAEIVKQDGDFMQVRFEKNKQERTEFIPLADIPVLICEEGNSGLDIQKTGVSALIAGRKAIFILDYGRALQAIVYK